MFEGGGGILCVCMYVCMTYHYGIVCVCVGMLVWMWVSLCVSVCVHVYQSTNQIKRERFHK